MANAAVIAPTIDVAIFVDTLANMTALRSVREVDRAVALFHALSDRTRLDILDMLKDGERCVCELQDQLEAAQSRLSFHLRVLKDAGLVTDRRDGRWMFYAIVPAALGEVHDLAMAMQPRKNALRGVRRACCQ